MDDPVLEKARSMVHQLYQLFKTHPHDQQWTKESRPLCAVSAAKLMQQGLVLVTSPPLLEG